MTPRDKLNISLCGGMIGSFIAFLILYMCTIPYEDPFEYTIIGYGDNSEYSEAITNVLSKDRCVKMYPVPQDMTGKICAYSNKSNNPEDNYASICDGDIGGPIFKDGVLYGIASKTVDCKNYPQIFTDVSDYKDFISYVLNIAK